MVAAVASKSQVTRFDGGSERRPDEVYCGLHRLRPAADQLHAEVRFRLVSQESIFLHQVAGDLSEAVTIGITMGERTKDQSEPDIAMSRSIRRPELQTHVHHVTEVQVD